MATRILVTRLLGKTTDFERKFAKAQLTLQRFERLAVQVGKRVGKLGKTLSIRLTTPIVAGLGLAIKSFASFDKAMTESLAIMGDVSEALRDDMVKAAKKVAETTTFSAKEAAEAFFFLASAGLDAEKSIAALPLVSKFAQAGAFNLAEATDLLTDAQSALGLTVKNASKNLTNMTRVADVLAKANTIANATVRQFAISLTSKAGVALKITNKSIEEGVAVLAAFADQGVKAELAGERLSIVLRDLKKAAFNNEEAFKAANVRVFDATGTLRNMADIIEDLEGALGGLSDKQKTATLSILGFQFRSQSALLTLVGLSGKIRDYQRQLEAAGGTTEEIAQKQLQALINTLIVVKNNVVLAAESIGELFEPIIRDVAKTVQAWAKEFRKLSDDQKRVIVRNALLIASIGPILIIVGKVITAFGLLAIGLQALGPIIAGVTAVGALSVLGWLAIVAAVGKMILEILRLNKATADLDKSMSALQDTTERGKKTFGTRNLAALRASLELGTAVTLERAIKLTSKQLEIEEQLNQATGLRKKQLEAQLSFISRTINKLDKALALQNQIAIVPPAAAPAGFRQTTEDILAQIEFERKLSNAVLDRLGTEGQINGLIERRLKLEEDIQKAQEGTKKFFELRARSLDIETRLTELAKTRADEIVRAATKKNEELTNRRAAAVEAGTVEAFRLRIRAEKKNLVEKNTKDAVKQLEKLLEVTKQNTAILQSGLKPGQELEVFVII